MPYTRDDVLEATDGLTAVTIPVHVTLESKQVVLAQPEMRALLAGAEVIAVGNCICREEARNCGNPLDVCIAFDDAARERIADTSWRTISVEDALAILERTYRLGLVHLAYRRWNGEINLVCSCCTCCCEPLAALRRFSYRDGITESAFVARLDVDRCIACGTCSKRCVFGAFEHASEGGPPTFNAERCFGCGLCVGTCPGEAIALVLRSD